MKKIFKYLGVIILIGFSFFYTDKVINVINEKDPIMIKLNAEASKYSLPSSNAIIVDNTIIPGIAGKMVDINKSYKNMREIGLYNPNNIVYKRIEPKISLTNNYDKFIIKGNKEKQAVSLIFTINNDLNLDRIIDILKENNTIANFFINYTYLNKNLNELRKEIINHEVYSLGNNLEYSPEVLIFSNNLIERTFKNKANVCLSSNYNPKTINTCAENDNYTINTNVVNYNLLKSSLESGNLIYLDSDTKSVNELDTIIMFIKSKGLQIIPISKLICE